jgi:hypothetical protein
MRLLLFMLGICVVIVSTGTRAQAQNYPWCSYYSESGGGGTLGGGEFRLSVRLTINLTENEPWRESQPGSGGKESAEATIRNQLARSPNWLSSPASAVCYCSPLKWRRRRLLVDVQVAPVFTAGM